MMADEFSVPHRPFSHFWSATPVCTRKAGRSFADRVVGLAAGRIVIDVAAHIFTDALLHSVYGQPNPIESTP